jgi:hypothetical protein
MRHATLPFDADFAARCLLDHDRGVVRRRQFLQNFFELLWCHKSPKPITVTRRAADETRFADPLCVTPG